MNDFNVSWLDLVPYENALDLQKRLRQQRLDGDRSDTLLLMEHPPVITVGADPEGQNHFRVDRETLERRGIQVHETHRGGHLTYHGPGQLVAYPIFELHDRDVHVFLRRLENVMIGTLAEFGLRATPDPDQPGVRVEEGKIGSIGIKLNRWVNMHGLALNVDMDRRPYGYIQPCARDEETMTTMEQQRSRAPMMREVREALVDQFEMVFNRGSREIPEEETWEQAYGEIPAAEERKMLPRRGEPDNPKRKPPWLKATVPGGSSYNEIRDLMDDKNLNTVCEEANCPNLGECWSRGTATFMILGDTCTRACGFCDVKTGKDLDLDEMEPFRVAHAVTQMDLDHTVITSVNRDDLPDGGAEIWARTIESVRDQNPGTTIEVLIPDLMGDWDALDRIFQAEPDILNHNVETVPRLYPRVRPQARFERSLSLLQRASRAGFPTKSGMMLGIGERRDEIKRSLEDLRDHGVDILTLGQYLRPSDQHLPVDRWVHPEEFDRWAHTAREMGFEHVESGPLVRSSYHADEQVPDPPVASRETS